MAAGLTPTSAAVTLTSFAATPVEDGVVLQWETATETDTLGFFILRKTRDEPPWDESFVLVDTSGNPYYEPAKSLDDPMGGLVPHQYEYRDVTAQRGVTYFYVLQEMDLNGDWLAPYVDFKRSATIPSAASPTPTVTLSPVPFTATATLTASPTAATGSAPNPTPIVVGAEPTDTPRPRRTATPTRRAPGAEPSSTPVPSATSAAPVMGTVASTLTGTPFTSRIASAVAAGTPTPIASPAPARLTPTSAGPGQAESAPGAAPSATSLTEAEAAGSATRGPTPSATPSRPAAAPRGTRTPVAREEREVGWGSGPPLVVALGGALILGLAAFGLTRFASPRR